MAVGTVYRHFPSKSDLFAEVFRRASQREVDAMRAGAAATEGGSAADRITAGTETFARRALAGRRLAWALLAEPVDPAVEAERLHFRHSYRDVIAEIVAEGVATGELPCRTRRRPPPPWSARSESRCSGPSPPRTAAIPGRRSPR